MSVQASSHDSPLSRTAVAYPRLVSGGGSESHKYKWLVKVGVSMGVTPWFKKIMAGGGFPGNQNTPWYAIALLPAFSPKTSVQAPILL